MKPWLAPKAVFQPIAIIVAIYAVLLTAGIRLHWAAGPPFYDATFGLLIAFALVAALVGLISIWASFTAMHWSTRASGVIAGAAVLVGVATLFFEWNEFLIWQLVLLIFADLACMVAILGALRICGYTVQRERIAAPQSATSQRPMAFDPRPSQFRVSNLLLMTSAFALLFSVLHYARPVNLNTHFYVILVIGGFCGAIVALAPVWACLSTSPLLLRIATLLVAMPIGGAVYAVLDYYEPLLFNWQWYAAVTALQVLFICAPLIVARAKGYHFGRTACD